MTQVTTKHICRDQVDPNLCETLEYGMGSEFFRNCTEWDGLRTRNGQPGLCL